MLIFVGVRGMGYMGTSYDIDVNDNTVHVVGTGRVTGDELMETSKSLSADPKLMPNMATLVDFSAVEDMDVTPACVRGLVAYLFGVRDTRGKSRQAFVVNRTGIALMIDLYILSCASAGLPHEVRLFQTKSEATEWLGIGTEQYSAA